MRITSFLQQLLHIAASRSISQQLTEKVSPWSSNFTLNRKIPRSGPKNVFGRDGIQPHYEIFGDLQVKLSNLNTIIGQRKTSA